MRDWPSNLAEIATVPPRQRLDVGQRLGPGRHDLGLGLDGDVQLVVDVWMDDRQGAARIGLQLTRPSPPHARVDEDVVPLEAIPDDAHDGASRRCRWWPAWRGVAGRRGTGERRASNPATASGMGGSGWREGRPMVRERGSSVACGRPGTAGQHDVIVWRVIRRAPGGGRRHGPLRPTDCLAAPAGHVHRGS